MTERDIDAIDSWQHDSGYISRATGPRREPLAICPVCGRPVPERPYFGDATCGEPSCREQTVRR